MNVLFIGGTGSISTACSHRVVSDGMDLSLLTRGTRNHRVPGSVPTITGNIDMLDNATVKFLRSKPWDVVVNWVVYTPEQAKRDIELFKGRVGHYVFVSSTAVYADTVPDHRLVETDPIGNTDWNYARNKLACEQIFQQAYFESQFPVTVVRPGHTYADFSMPTNIAGFGYGLIERMKSGQPVILHDGGTSIWTLTYDSDFADGFVRLFGSKQAYGQIYHITSSEIATWRQIMEIYAGILGVEPVFTEISSKQIAELSPKLGPTFLGDRSRNRSFDNSKILTIIPDFAPVVTMEQGIGRVIGWHAANPELIRFDPAMAAEVTRIIEMASSGKFRCSETRTI